MLSHPCTLEGPGATAGGKAQGVGAAVLCVRAPRQSQADCSGAKGTRVGSSKLCCCDPHFYERPYQQNECAGDDQEDVQVSAGIFKQQLCSGSNTLYLPH